MGSIKDKGMSTLPFTRKLDTLSNIHETNAIEKDMKDLFRKKRKLELFYMVFCAATMIIGNMFIFTKLVTLTGLTEPNNEAYSYTYSKML